MIEGVIIVPILWIVMSAIYMLLTGNLKEGTKGIHKDVYYGRKTGKQYTAERSRQEHIV
tara:strand:+ start:206 stop:382 length:177 start_codon:yes stop_codon:yes gene_type:complete